MVKDAVHLEVWADGTWQAAILVRQAHHAKELHTAWVGPIHLGPARGVSIALCQQTRRAETAQVQRREHAHGAAAHNCYIHLMSGSRCFEITHGVTNALLDYRSMEQLVGFVALDW